ncbi:gliding motility-associated C-terminal domain-containing protein [Taibaiella soli]|uniref:DUF8202 domain-containing protein n=1 Tax=Taibaiella soli TaxID=1649169 RepID=A0A2W2BH51_9BACT|nr:gliding motility-associated C-terminal domain-containing protein [Taibaiella soli]PZF72806.1 hypothetical protein DN068_10340 [Taibaiella soli]
MKRNILFVFCLLLTVPVLAQSTGPGGISSGLNFWIKANTGTTVAGGVVNQWNDMSGAGITGNMNLSALNPNNFGPSLAPVGINFNPHVVFDRTKPNSMITANQFLGNQLFNPSNVTILQVIKLHSFTGTGVWLKWENWNQSPRLGFEVDNGGTTIGQLRFDFGTSGTTMFTPVNVNDQYILSDAFVAPTTGTNALKTVMMNGAQIATATTTANTTTCQGKIGLGNEPTATTPACGGTSIDQYPTTVDVAEIAIYNQTLSPADRNKAESYLAVKYGFTLDQSATYANNYTSASGTTIWDRTANLPFINNITGIGRDDASALDQRQSKSINTAGLVTVLNGSYNGSTSPVDNVSNTNTFAANNSFLLFGDNAAAITYTRCFTSTVSAQRISRVWKVQKTGSVNTVTISIKASDFPAGIKHLLVSTDSAISPTNTTVYAMTSQNGILTASLTLANNSYFTFASDTLALHPTSNSPLCTDATIQLNANLSGTAAVQWAGPNSFTSTQANPSIPNATPANSGVYTVSGTINGCPLTPGSVNVQVTNMPAPPTVTTPIFYCTGDNAVPVTANGTNLLWYYSPNGGTGTATPPTPSTLAADTLVYWVTQSVNGCEGIRTKLEVAVRTRPNGIILATQSTICQYGLDTFNYFGSALTTDQYDWKFPLGASTLLSGSGQGPFIARFDSTGPQKVRLQVNHEGCVSPESFYTVQVNAAPQLRTAIKDSACANETVIVSLNYATPGIDNYTWNFGSGTVVYGAAGGGPFGVKWANAGPQQVTVIASAKGCPSMIYRDTINIHPLPYAHLDSISNTDICSGDTVAIKANLIDSGSHYTWTPVRYFGVVPDTQRLAYAQVPLPGYLAMYVTDSFGCVAGDSVFVNAKNCCEVYLPDAFTPNNDSKNDIFKIITIGNHKIQTFRIVNRWGQVVFETADESVGWDGTFGGAKQEMGTYFYYLKYRCVNGKDYEMKGELTLIR